VIHEDKLSTVLSEFARTVITDFPIQGILDHLVQRIVDVLPITSAGVTLISPGSAPHYIAASDNAALRFERLQTELGEGPCLAAYESGQAVAVPDLRAVRQFTRFAPAAVSAGLAAVFTFPLRHGDAPRLGALDLYRNTPGDLDPSDMDTAQTLADVAAAYLLNAQARDAARAASDRFHHDALHDALTGLPNRLLLQERLEHAAQLAKRSHTTAAILFADLDRFKEVNDKYGHKVGDQLLRAVAERLLRVVRSSDTLARYAGDEFVLLCEDMRSVADVEIIAQRLGAAFEQPFVLPGVSHAIRLSASIGMAFAGPGEDISDNLVVRADYAMYQVKHARDAANEVIDIRAKGHQVFDIRGKRNEVIDVRGALPTIHSSTLESDLRSALDNDDLEVAYQPIVRNADRCIVGVEALLRWTHPDRGVVAPMTMVRVAEQSNLINDLGAWVLERSCRDRGRWMQDHPHSQLELAVNVSARQLAGSDFCGSVAAVLERTGMNPNALVLEITENVLVDDGEHALTVLSDLSGLGIRLALDDFGTGFSSLSYLRRLPIHIVKIDQSFIADIGHSAADRAIVEAVTNLAHVLGLAVTAEGVETQSQCDEVSAIGCENAQGYFYARPMPASAIGVLLAA
jgi:diguanylate cyclase (GGDEF)-like protein